MPNEALSNFSAGSCSVIILITLIACWKPVLGFVRRRDWKAAAYFFPLYAAWAVMFVLCVTYPWR